MAWWLKAGLTAGLVLLVMAAARLGRGRWAGAVAALPTITAPTLAWLAEERGVDFAVEAAIGSVAACAVLAAFAAAYAQVSRHRGIAPALAGGVAGALAMAAPAFAASARLSDALALALVCSALACVAIPGSDRTTSPRRSSRQALIGVAATAGGLTALAALVGPSLGPFAAGLLSSLPLISWAAAAVEHAAGGHRAAAGFLRGYAGGLFGKATFGAVYALLATRLGAAPALALAGACTLLVALLGGRRLPRDTATRGAAIRHRLGWMKQPPRRSAPAPRGHAVPLRGLRGGPWLRAAGRD